MSTTSLFVELIVIGAGVLVWLILFVASAFGLDWLTVNDANLLASALPALAFIYVLGIVWDRIADGLFKRLWGNQLRQTFFPDLATYYKGRRDILTGSTALTELIEYGRSRLRICRGWSLNSIMIGIGVNTLVWTQHSQNSKAVWISVFGSILSLALAVSSWFAWRSISQADYRKIRDQVDYLARKLAEED